jgi:hypothetical protein
MFYSRAVPKKNVAYFPAFFGERFVEKEGGLRTHNKTAKEEGGLEVYFCIELIRTLYTD